MPKPIHLVYRVKHSNVLLVRWLDIKKEACWGQKSYCQVKARAISPRAVAATRVNRNRHQGVSVKELDVRCRKSLGRYMPVMSIMRRERQLLQIWSLMSDSIRVKFPPLVVFWNGSFRSHQVFKSQRPIKLWYRCNITVRFPLTFFYAQAQQFQTNWLTVRIL